MRPAAATGQKGALTGDNAFKIFPSKCIFISANGGPPQKFLQRRTQAVNAAIDKTELENSLITKLMPDISAIFRKLYFAFLKTGLLKGNVLLRVPYQTLAFSEYIQTRNKEYLRSTSKILIRTAKKTHEIYECI